MSCKVVLAGVENGKCVILTCSANIVWLIDIVHGNLLERGLTQTRTCRISGQSVKTLGDLSADNPEREVLASAKLLRVEASAMHDMPGALTPAEMGGSHATKSVKSPKILRVRLRRLLGAPGYSKTSR
jgi:hypothetical protein